MANRFYFCMEMVETAPISKIKSNIFKANTV